MTKKYRLNDTNVPEGMWYRARDLKDAGAKIFLAYPQHPIESPLAAKDTHCKNCDGFGRLGLEKFVGGPFTDATDKHNVVWHEGAYYVHDVVLYICPDCNGSGLFYRASTSADKLSL